MSYGSQMHQKAYRMRHMTAEERRKRKEARIARKKKARHGDEGFNPLRGIAGFLSALKNIRNKGEQNASQRKARENKRRRAPK